MAGPKSTTQAKRAPGLPAPSGLHSRAAYLRPRFFGMVEAAPSVDGGVEDIAPLLSGGLAEF